MSSLRLVPLIVERDIRILFSDTFLIGIMFANFGIDLFVTAATFGRLIPNSVLKENYFLYIAPGSNFVTAMVAAFQSGRDVWREKYIKDLASYLFTLPAPRRVLALSRLAGGVARSVIATFPGTLVISYLYGILVDPRVFAAFLIVGLFSLGIVGLSISLSAFASSIEMFVTIRSAIQLYLSFLSTLFYRTTVFPSVLVPIVVSNPMTWAVEAFRSLPQSSGLIGPISVLVLPSLAFATLGVASYLYYARL
jgi:ABC-type polysaccharide/polyol phosphate export permease